NAHEVMRSRCCARLTQLLHGKIGTTDLTDLSGFDRIIERAEGVFNWCFRIRAVNLIEVDVVGLKSAKTGIQRFADIFGARSFLPLAHLDSEFCRDDRPNTL